jgi:hypothetical protein
MKKEKEKRVLIKILKKKQKQIKRERPSVARPAHLTSNPKAQEHLG